MLSRLQKTLLSLAALMYVAAGLLHFLIPHRYLRVMPAWVPFPLVMIYLSGVAEIAGGVGLLVPRYRRIAVWGLVLLLIVVFPVNVKMALDSPQFLYWARLPLQGVLIWWVFWSSRERGSVVS